MYVPNNCVTYEVMIIKLELYNIFLNTKTRLKQIDYQRKKKD